MKYGKLENNWVQETFICENGKTIYDYFHEELAGLFKEVPDNVEAGWYKNQDGSFSAPPESPKEIPVTTT
jgi:hypothetical protein